MSKHRAAPVDQLSSPAASSGLFEVFRRRYLLKLLVRREISARYQGSFLGLFWSYLQPASRLAMYYFVFGILFARPIENYAIHLFAGLVIVHYFTETFGSGTRSIVRNKGVVQKMAVPREMFPVASMLVSAYHVIPGLVLLSGLCVVLGWTPDPLGIAAGLLGFLLVAVLGTACALLFSVANVYFRDFSNVVSLLTMFVTFSVPMMYPYSLVQERFGALAPYYLVNPLAEAVLLFQRCFWIGTTDNPEAMIATNMPDHLFEIGLAHVGAGLVVLVFAQLGVRPLREEDPGAPLMPTYPHNASIVVDHVSKDFKLRHHRTMKQMTVAMLRRQQLSTSFSALDDVTFTVRQGESIGIMGLNGSGKSTLLKLINGIMRPDRGEVLTRGRIAGLIATGTGFHQQLSGRDNIFLNAAVLGMSEAETKRKLDSIIEFADIGQHLDSQVGHYSSGMTARLGFAIAIHVDSDIFLADEVLAVGDKPFKKKCMEKMQEIRDSGRTLFYVSHSAGSVRKMCDRVIVLESGRVGFDGPVDAGIRYLKYEEANETDEELADDEIGADV